MTLDLSAITALDPIATLPVGGSLGFLANGNLMAEVRCRPGTQRASGVMAAEEGNHPS